MLIALERLFLWFLLYSFIGWVYESILVSVQERRFVNRGFLNGPLCPIYGTGASLAIVLLGHMTNPVLIFLISMIGATLLEYVTSWGMERLFHARWWDYSNFHFNINGRVCLLGAVVFGFGGVAIVLGAQPIVAELSNMIPIPALHTLATVLFILTAIDVAVTVAGILDFAQMLDTVSETVQDYVAKAGESWQWGSSAVAEKVAEWSQGSQETLEHVRQAVADVVNAQQRRMLKSFPKFQVLGRQDVIDSLRELMRPRH
ncbi:putative ABC transporter permease [Bifidobacterium oedipodis]|uniref:Transporter n=1 Tax=Bifidobacterium oedipodis TaxID=2675322 RepID=A0A7Y0HS34_9BIFI|nr:putative ABC transporter permease [Bifidobacterium sp. DSM 109957]NMM93571.1 Transporter [Bifidobacterium sp. DSM 109957]